LNITPVQTSVIPDQFILRVQQYVNDTFES